MTGNNSRRLAVMMPLGGCVITIAGLLYLLPLDGEVTRGDWFFAALFLLGGIPLLGLGVGALRRRFRRD